MFVLVALLVAHERHATPWRDLARDLGPVPPAFFLPLDARSKGAQTALETGPHGEKILWGYGPKTRLRFHTLAPMRLRLCYAFTSPVRDQTVAVAVNEHPVAAYDARKSGLPDDAGHPACRDFTSRAGDNRISFAYRAWNHGGDDFAADDPRPLAATFTMLQLLPVPGDPAVSP
ncbi:hypothetical protein [Solidesulfovibrio fructosivorans]|uniref:hypothetical protein n=1 Tax=Solidesulfovibrio fructosivorans TaxID=878 RepID=UPI00117FC448|nr:hypothetical protein [Solidesulfovibrio fructosivorans]